MKEILTVIAIIVIFIIGISMIVSQQIDQYGKYYNKKQMHSLLDFLHYVATCDVTEPNMYVIEIRLRQERAKREMNTPSVCNRVNEIGQLYERRFAELLQDREEEILNSTVRGKERI